MPVPFKKDPTDYNQRQLLATNVFDLLSDDDCFIYEDIFSTIDTKEVLKKIQYDRSACILPKTGNSNTYLFLQSGNI